jgi:hypothetical protein
VTVAETERPSRAIRKHLRGDAGSRRRGRPRRATDEPLGQAPLAPAPAGPTLAAPPPTPAPRWAEATAWIHASYIVPVHERYKVTAPSELQIGLVLDALQATVERHFPALPSDPAVTLVAVSVMTFAPLALAVWREHRPPAAPPAPPAATPPPPPPAGGNGKAGPWDALARKEGQA